MGVYLRLVFVLSLTLLLPASALADSIYGSCRTKSGEKCTGIHKISTSWNSKKTYPSNGSYSLDLGGTVKKRITVYCDGSSVGVSGGVKARRIGGKRGRAPACG